MTRTGLKSGTGSFLPVPKVDPGNQVLGLSSAPFSKTLAELDVKQLDFKAVPVGDVSVAGSSLVYFL